MKKIDAIIKPFKLDDVREALAEVGITGMTVTEVKGFGRQKGHTELYRGAGVYGGFSAESEKLRLSYRTTLSIPVSIPLFARRKPAKIGDGKIFVFDVARVIRIRTGEEDDAAI
ncbi:P-II family nitrogen regulator [Escherichia coli]